MLNLPGDFLNYISKYGYLILVFVLLQGSLLVILGYVFVERVLTTRKRRNDEAVVKEEAYQEALKILDKAKEESLRILLNSEQKARSILQDTGQISDETKDLITKELFGLLNRQKQEVEKVSNELIDSYKSTIDTEKSRSVKEISKVSTILKDEVMSEISQLKDVFQRETIESEKNIKLKAGEEYESIRNELSNYKKERMSQIEQHIYEIVVQTSKEVIGKAMSLDDHEELILESLQRAREENKFKV